MLFQIRDLVRLPLSGMQPGKREMEGTKEQRFSLVS
jgi:hypothetical protein